MASSLHITITQSDLLNGKRYNPRECAIALAARRTIGDRDVVVCPAVLVVNEPGSETWYTIPPELQKLQEEFDAAPWDDFERVLAEDFQPTTFILPPFEHRPRSVSRAQAMGLPSEIVL